MSKYTKEKAADFFASGPVKFAAPDADAQHEAFAACVNEIMALPNFDPTVWIQIGMKVYDIWVKGTAGTSIWQKIVATFALIQVAPTPSITKLYQAA